jgi:hypothetical protein
MFVTDTCFSDLEDIFEQETKWSAVYRLSHSLRAETQFIYTAKDSRLQQSHDI